MSKMNAREVFMLMILINVALYYLGIQIVVNPLLKERINTNAEIQQLQIKNTEIKEAIRMNDSYLADIVTLLDERRVIYEGGFPDAQTEVIHKFINEKSLETNIQVMNISINPKIETTTNEKGEIVESIFKSNEVSLNVTGNYANIMKFIKSIEDLKRTSALKRLNLSGTNDNMTVSMTFVLLTVEKDVKDNIFDYTFSGAQGSHTLKIQ